MPKEDTVRSRDLIDSAYNKLDNLVKVAIKCLMNYKLHILKSRARLLINKLSAELANFEFLNLKLIVNMN